MEVSDRTFRHNSRTGSGVADSPEAPSDNAETMRIPLNTSRWYDRILASFIFYTRLPLWRIRRPSDISFRCVTEYWPLTGWLTGGLTAAIIYFATTIVPYPAAVVMAMATRVWLTGAIHEDGLRRFCDSMSYRTDDPRRTLAVMKSPLTGTRGVIALVFYELAVCAALCSMTPAMAAATVFAADPYTKMVAGQLTIMMPHVRTDEEVDAGLTFRRMPAGAGMGFALQGLLPLAAYIYIIMCKGMDWQMIVFAPCLVMYGLYLLVNRQLHGYTHECCGAAYLLLELTFFLTAAALMWSNGGVAT